MARKLEVQILGDSRDLERAFNRSALAAGRFSGQLQGGVSRSLRVAGLAATGLGTVMAGGVTAGLASSAKAAVSFDKAMRNVNSIARLSEAQFKRLEASVTSMAAEVGQSPQTLAEGLYDLESSGFAANDAIQILRVSARAATAGLTDTATASGAVAAALNAYHLKATDAKNVSDILFQTVNKGVLTFEQLAGTMGDLVPAAAPLGVGLDEVGAAMATLTLQGVSADEAATRVKNTMLSLAHPSVELTKIFKAHGFASGEAAVKARGFAGVLELISAATKGNVSATQKLEPEVRALLGVVGLTGKNLKTYNDNLKAMRDAQQGAGVTAQVFAEQSKSVAVQWQKASAAIDVFKVQIGTALLPTLTSAVGAIARLFAQLNAASGFRAKMNIVWEGLEKVASDLMAKIQAAIFGSDTRVVLNAAQSFDVHTDGLLDKIRQQFDTLDWTSVGEGIANGIANAVSSGAPAVKKIAGGLSDAIKAIDWEAAGKAMGPGLATAVAVAFKTLLDPSFWMRHWDLALAVFVAAFPLGKLAKLTVIFTKLGGDMMLGLLGAIERFAPRIASLFLAMMLRLPGVAKAAFEKLSSLVASAFPRIGSLAKFTVKVLGIQAVIDAIVQLGTDIGAKMAEIAADAFNWATDIGTQIVQGITSSLSDAGPSILAAMSNPVSWALKHFDVPGFSPPEHAAAEAIGRPLAKGVILGYLTGTGDLPSKMSESVRKGLEAARSAVQASQSALASAFSRLADYALRAFDARTEAGLDRIRAKFDRLRAEIDAAASEQTPAEQELAREQEGRDRAQRDADEEKARADVAAAQTPEDKAAAEKELADALWEQRRAELEALAAIERADREQMAADARADADRQQAEAEKQYQARRDLQRQHFEDDLADLQAALAKQGAAHAAAHKRLMALYKKYGVDFRQSGKDLGDAFADGMREAFEHVEKTAAAMAALVAKYLPHSPAERGALSVLPGWDSYLTHGLDAALVSTSRALDAGLRSPNLSGLVAGGDGGSIGTVGARGDLHVHVHVDGMHYGDVKEAARELAGPIRQELKDIVDQGNGSIFNGYA